MVVDISIIGHRYIDNIRFSAITNQCTLYSAIVHVTPSPIITLATLKLFGVNFVYITHLNFFVILFRLLFDVGRSDYKRRLLIF